VIEDAASGLPRPFEHNDQSASISVFVSEPQNKPAGLHLLQFPDRSPVDAITTDNYTQKLGAHSLMRGDGCPELLNRLVNALLTVCNIDRGRGSIGLTCNL
jgi:hypothetical protein